jgi:hypothetical protein
MITLLNAVTTATTGSAASSNAWRNKILTNITGTAASVTVHIEEQVGGVWFPVDETTHTTLGAKGGVLIDRLRGPVRARTSAHGAGVAVTVFLQDS